ncbi:hypothetical protein [Chryseosolibacter indicus]|uniref:Uncharacterized protein n=1 Tax=Chryseosolibacter indicus TaxID=2782351 RepID=A0ABS5VNC4_9BACT|nr:hypothetical protein [Chryseosolibacter indicus]MBT1702940.1 hypothetical protein [Chryseosolibacter indicus]
MNYYFIGKVFPIFIVLICSFIVSQSQVVPVRTKSIEELYTVVDSIAAITKYKLAKIDTSYSQRDLIGFKLGKVNSADTITVLFFKTKEGGNVSLERSGYLMYNFKELSGRYLDIFPIWKKYFNTSANLEVIANNGGDYARDYKPKEEGWYSRINFRKSYKNYWVIK